MISDTFALDVLERVKKMKLKLNGCDPTYLESFEDGSLKLWFSGIRNGRVWQGGLTIMPADVATDIELSRSDVLAETMAQIIDHNNSRFY